MEIVCDNYKEKETKDTTCVHCGSVLRYTEDDIVYLAADHMMPSVKCPCCGSYFEVEDFSIDEIEDIHFPDYFDCFSVDKNAVEIDDKLIDDWIKEGIRTLRCTPDENLFTVGSGNTRIFILRLGGDEVYNICVAKNYYEMDFPFEQIDYDLNNDDDTRFEYCAFGE